MLYMRIGSSPTNIRAHQWISPEFGTVLAVCAHVFCSRLHFGNLSRLAAGGSKCSAQPKWADCLSKGARAPQPLKRLSRAFFFFVIHSLVFPCPSTEFFLMDLKHFQKEWANFPGTATCQAFSLAAQSLSALQTMYSIQDGFPLL